MEERGVFALKGRLPWLEVDLMREGSQNEKKMGMRQRG
jgi:hypothetical protein